MSKEISLSRGKFALVDDADYEWLSQWKWCCSVNGYAVRRANSGGSVYMHRAITDCPCGMYVDHVNHDTLDNRRTNLRVATPTQNHGNSLPRGRRTSLPEHVRTSIFKGVVMRMERWQAQVYVHGTTIRLGRFLTQRAAAAAYNEAASRYFGEYAFLNDLSLLPEHLDVPIVEKRRGSGTTRQ